MDLGSSSNESYVLTGIKMITSKMDDHLLDRFIIILNFFSGARAGGPVGHKLKLIVDKLAGIL